MAEQNCSSRSSPTPIIITSTTEQVKSDVDDSNSLSSSCDSRNFVEKNCSSSDEYASFNSQSPQANSKLLFSDPTISSSSENRNGVTDKSEKGLMGKTTSFLRPSILSSGFSSFSTKHVESTKGDSSFGLKSPKLNLATSKFGDASVTNASVTQTKNAFTSSVSFGNDKNKSHSSLSSSSSNSLQAEANNTGNGTDGKSSKTNIGIFSNAFNSSTNTTLGATPKTSVISVPNFVFGQNLHERVTDSVKTSNEKDKPSPDIKTNGSSDMLFSSVLTSKDVKENFSGEVFGNSKEPSSLIEDAARCQEARANKRKYEEVLVTTGEEGEQNILQVNVKLFAFDNGAWVERGRGILRLNDKNCGGETSSRIVIRTVGSLRVVLNTKIWSGMSLNRASERSARLTAIDPNGQVKIFLVQASLKDMTSLYPLLADRIKLCKEQDSDSEESPQKKVALDNKKM